jgi:hypothetical protein
LPQISSNDVGQFWKAGLGHFCQAPKDNMALPAMAQRLYTPEPKQMALIADGGHEDSSEVNPTAYFGALNGFLSKSV